MSGTELTVQQTAFVENVAKGKPHSIAYVEAGYACKNMNVAKSAASRLLTNVNVKVALDKLMNKVAKKAEWDVGRLISSFEEIFERSMQHEQVFLANGEATGEYKFDASGANKSLENIAKIIGAYQQTEGNTVIINQFLTNVQNKYGIVEAL